MDWSTAFGQAEKVDPSEDTIINGTPYRARPVRSNVANDAAHPARPNKRPDSRLAEELRRRALAMMRAR